MSWSEAHATTYFIDFENGSDLNSGTATNAAWKHCPGDRNAGSSAASTVISPGDFVFFKGGVEYLGEIIWAYSGSITGRITIAGNRWGNGTATLSGYETIVTTWQHCTNAAQCNGNTNYSKIYVADYAFPTNQTPICLIKYDESTLIISSYPDITNQVSASAVAVKGAVVTNDTPQAIGSNYFVSTKLFTQAAATYWTNSYIGVLVAGNSLRLVPVQNYNPASNTVYYSMSGTVPSSGPVSYMLYNNVGLINAAGEYAVDIARGKIFLWPPNNGNPNLAKIKWAKRRNAFRVNNKTFITIEGFNITGYASDFNTGYLEGSAVILNAGSLFGTHSIDIVDVNAYELCALNGTAAIAAILSSNVTVRGCSVQHCIGSAGMAFGLSRDLTIVSNTVSDVGRTGVYFGTASNVLCAFNTIFNIQGTHANGLSVYQNSGNVTVSGNHIYGCTLPFTVEYVRRLAFLCNLIEHYTTDASAFNDWGGTIGPVLVANNTIIGLPNGNSIYLAGSSMSNYSIVNNIIGGAHITNAVHRYNVYTSYYWTQNPALGWSLGKGESTNTLMALVRSTNDFRLKAGSPAIGVGTNLTANGVINDINGIVWPMTSNWDIGCHRYVPLPSAPPTYLRVVPE